MNIAHVLPYAAKFPLQKHNGRYEWALRLANAQALAGHDVTIYAGPSSDTKGSTINYVTLPEALADPKSNNTALFESAFTFDEHQIFHSHLDSLHYELANKTDKPVVVTQHWFPTAEIAAVAPLNSRRNVVAVPVTHFMAKADREMGIPAADTIYHGIDLQVFPASYGPRTDRLLFVGRIAPHKGVAEVVQAVLTAGDELDIVGKINAKDQAYWDAILPYVDGVRIRYLGAKTQQEVAALMARAKAMIFLPSKLEAFGQTIIESQACGTPVILNNLGANSELVNQGVSGFVLNDGPSLSDTIKAISNLDPHDCRAFAEQFSLETMVQSYEALYRKLIK